MRPLVALALACTLGGCGGDGPAAPAGGPLRLIDDPGIARDRPFLAWGVPIEIGGESRPVLSASAPVLPPSEHLQRPGGQRVSRGMVPTNLAAVPWIIIESVVTRDGRTKMMRSWPMVGAKAGTEYNIPHIDALLGPDGTPTIVLRPVPDLATRDVETGEVRVPAGAVLTTAVGIEPSSLDSSTVPLDMTVAAVADGQEQTLRTVRIEASRPEAKRWIDLRVPLDALAGRTVRFRFRARPMLGPTAVPSLPVWADPTVTAAPGPA